MREWTIKWRLEINNIFVTPCLYFQSSIYSFTCSYLLFTSPMLLSFKVKIPQDGNHDSWQSATNGKISNGNAKGNQEKEDEGEEAGKLRNLRLNQGWTRKVKGRRNLGTVPTPNTFITGLLPFSVTLFLPLAYVQVADHDVVLWNPNLIR